MAGSAAQQESSGVQERLDSHGGGVPRQQQASEGVRDKQGTRREQRGQGSGGSRERHGGHRDVLRRSVGPGRGTVRRGRRRVRVHDHDRSTVPPPPIDEGRQGPEVGPNTVYDLRQQHTSEKGQPHSGRLTWATSTIVGAGVEKACKSTNNTGELTALLHALRRASRRGRHAPKEVVWVDSLYARNLTLGIWLPRKGKNIQLVKQLRQEWRQTQIRRGRHAVRIEHVRSHTGVPGNELADRLADAGMYLDRNDPNAPYGLGSKLPIRAMMDAVAKTGRETTHQDQPPSAAGAPLPIGRGAAPLPTGRGASPKRGASTNTPHTTQPHPSDPPTLSPSEQTASGEG